MLLLSTKCMHTHQDECSIGQLRAKSLLYAIMVRCGCLRYTRMTMEVLFENLVRRFANSNYNGMLLLSTKCMHTHQDECSIGQLRAKPLLYAIMVRCGSLRYTRMTMEV